MDQSLLLYKLREHPSARFRMDKSDAPAVRADARLRIDQADARRFQTFQGRFQIRHGVRDMMHPLTTFSQVTCDGTVRIYWSNQFDPACSGAKRRNLNRLLGEHEPFASGKTQRSVTRQRLVEVSYDNRNVVQHGIDVQRQGGTGTGH